RRHTRFSRDWSSDVCSSDLTFVLHGPQQVQMEAPPKAFADDGDKTVLRRAAPAKPATLEIAGGTEAGAKKPRAARPVPNLMTARSEERRVGKECRSRCRSRA